MASGLIIHDTIGLIIKYQKRQSRYFSKRYCLNPGEYSTLKPCPVESAQMI